MVGGICALIGAKILGPRIGKYDKDGKPRAILGHNLTFAALGVFILWFCWFGFNGASTVGMDSDALVETAGRVFFNTNMAAAVACCTTLIFTWIRYKKPDVSMTYNAALAGLVGITAGLFATGVTTEAGLFYGGGIHFLTVQIIGVVSVAVYVAIVITIVFLAIKHTIGLRADAEDEIAGLDVSEHGLLTAYAGFSMVPDTATADEADTVPVMVTGETPVAEAVPVKKVPGFEEGTPKFTKIEIVCKESRFEALKSAMMKLGITGMLLPKVQIEMVVSAVPVRKVIETAKKVLYTGHIGDGKIFVYDVENVVKVRTGEEGFDALQDVE